MQPPETVAMSDHITYDPAYDTVAPDDFQAMLEVDRYGRRSDAFDEIIARTHDHFWDPMDQRLRRILEMRILKTAEDMVRSRFRGHRDDRLGALLDEVVARRLDPYAAAEELLAAVGEG
jgi:hypothetical protein